MRKLKTNSGSKHYQACEAIAKMFSIAQVNRALYLSLIFLALQFIAVLQDMEFETKEEKKEREKKEKQRLKEAQEQSQYVLSRFVPRVKGIIEVCFPTSAMQTISFFFLFVFFFCNLHA
jgi:hypothetical protein